MLPSAMIAYPTHHNVRHYLQQPTAQSLANGWRWPEDSAHFGTRGLARMQNPVSLTKNVLPHTVDVVVIAFVIAFVIVIVIAVAVVAAIVAAIVVIAVVIAVAIVVASGAVVVVVSGAAIVASIVDLAAACIPQEWQEPRRERYKTPPSTHQCPAK